MNAFLPVRGVAPPPPPPHPMMVLVGTLTAGCTSQHQACQGKWPGAHRSTSRTHRVGQLQESVVSVYELKQCILELGVTDRA